MTDLTWVPVVPLTDVVAPPWPCHVVAGHAVRLVRAPDGHVVAISPTCPHLASPLDRAEMEEDQVLCPRHWYAYDARTGQNLHPGLDRAEPLTVYPVDVRDGVVHVAVTDA